MNVQDLLNALSGLDQKVGLGPQPTPPPMAPPSSPLAALLNLRSATPGSIHDWMTQGQPGADYRQATNDYASNLIASGADPSLPPLAQLVQQSMGTAQGIPAQGGVPPSDPLGGSNYLPDLMTQRQPGSILDAMQHNQTSGMNPGPLMPQIDYPANLPIGADAPSPVAQYPAPGDVTDFPARSGSPTAPVGGPASEGGIWNSILNGLSSLGGPGSGLYAMTHDPQAQGQFMDQLHKIFGIGKGADQGPQGPGILDQLAGQLNDAQAGANAGAKGKAGSGAGSVTTYGLGQYQEPPPAPHEAIPPAMDLSGVMDEIRKAEPQRVPLNITKGTSILEGIAHGMASGAGHGFGTQLLAGAAGGLSGEVGYAHEQQRDEQNFQRAMQDFHYRVAEGELHQAQLGDEHNKLAAEIDYRNQTNDYQRQLSIIEAHKPQAQMTNAGLVVQQVNPKNGQYEIKVDSRPIDHILEARMALRGMGASPMALSSFTSQATGAAGHHAGPADAALNLAVQLTDRPDLWPGLFGDKYPQFQQQVQNVMGKGSAYGTLADDRKGKIGQMQTDVTSTSAIARMLQNFILADPSQEAAKRAVGLLSGQALIGDKNKVVQNPFGLH